MENREEIDELLFGLYDDGVLYGQRAMIRSMQDLGLINDNMAAMIENAIVYDRSFEQHLRREDQEEKMRTVMEQLEKLTPSGATAPPSPKGTAGDG